MKKQKGKSLEEENSEDNMMQKIKKQSGITLVALVVTIIVLLILAGVAISMLSGENGILNQAANAKQETETQSILEKIKLAVAASMINTDLTVDETELKKNLTDYFGTEGTGYTITENSTSGWTIKVKNVEYTVSSTGNLKEVVPPVAIATLVGKTATESKTIKVEDESEPKQTFYIPGGFKLASDSAITVDEGIVIEGEDGSQFVWVPVPVAIWDGETTVTSGTYTPMVATYSYNGRKYYRGMLYEFSSTDGTTATYSSENNVGTINYREPSLLTGEDDWYAPMTSVTGTIYDVIYSKSILEYSDVTAFGAQMQKDYDEMVKSVDTYGGFYVGRYETGIETVTDETTGITTTKIVSKNASTNSSTITTADSTKPETNMWYGLYKAQKEYSTTRSTKSSMIWGSQYDAMMNWMARTGYKVGISDEDKDNDGWVTGSSSTDVINKVYDLYGCHDELTLEAINSAWRTARGGYFKSTASPAGRNKSSAKVNETSSFESSRLSIYIIEN